MTTINQLPFALPIYGSSMQRNAFFAQSAGQYLMPMRSFAYSVIEQLGGVPVNYNTRPHNAEFKVVNGQHFMQIMKGMGIHIKHMEPVSGGYKCYKEGNRMNSVCFVQKKANTQSGCIEYTAVLAMRQVAYELFIGAFPIHSDQLPVDSFVEEAMSQADPNEEYLTDEEVKYATPLSNEELEALGRKLDLPFPEVPIDQEVATVTNFPPGL